MGAIASFALAATPMLAQAPTSIDAYDVVWRSPSNDASGSMPIGNGEVGCNVWCDAEGFLNLLVSRTDSFSEASRLLKLGTIRIKLGHDIKSTFYEQRLCLREGCIRVVVGDGAQRIALKVFVDSASDLICIVGEGENKGGRAISGHSWRTQSKHLVGEELRSSWTMQEAPPEMEVREAADDMVVLRDPARAGFFHHNETSVAPFTLARQGLSTADAPPLADPLLHRSFGLLFGGKGYMPGPVHADRIDPEVIFNSGRPVAHVIAAPCVQSADKDAWLKCATDLLAKADVKAAEQRTAAWWAAFWERSTIFVSGDSAHAIPANAHPLRIGADSSGGNIFGGSIDWVRVVGRVESTSLLLSKKWDLSASDAPTDAATAMSAQPKAQLPLLLPQAAALDLTRGLTVRAVVRQSAATPIGRIVDKCTAGSSDGFLFDTHPGRALRFIVGARILIAENALSPDQTHSVAATFDPATGRMALYCDGVLLKASDEPLEGQPPSRITEALLLQRWIQACGGRGRFPIKFNGSIFTVAPKFTQGQPHNEDWRKWGDCFWWQNTRLPYYPMLAQGDFEMTDPLFRLYSDTLAVARERVRSWYGGKAEGAYWPETMSPFGSHANNDYGWKRDGLPSSKVLCPWWEYVRNQGLELLALMLERWDYERDPAFLKEHVLPLAVPILAWFETAYPRDEQWRLKITPTQSLETFWHGVQDDMPTVAGLHWVLPRLLELPATALDESLRERWRKLHSALPPMPLRDQDGVRVLSPAGAFDPRSSNCENPELYAVFPFRHYGLGKPDLQIARDSWNKRVHHINNGWPQDGQIAALLGLVPDAQNILLAKVQNHNRAHRFPAMWGPNFDWCPDQCHGGNLLDMTQRMLLQCDGDAIRVLPCWPKEWDVSFKLHAPQRTTVEVVWRDGKIEKLEVTPKARAKDVIIGQN